jgi:hypothetical protein
VRNPENVDGSETGRVILEAATDGSTTNEINTRNVQDLEASATQMPVDKEVVCN